MLPSVTDDPGPRASGGAVPGYCRRVLRQRARVDLVRLRSRLRDPFYGAP